MNEVKERNNSQALIAVESDVDVQELQGFNSLLDQDMIVRMGDNLMGVHPSADEIGTRGLRTVAQLALMTGANPLPGTNGIHAWRDNKGKLCIQFGIGFWRGQAEAEGGIVWIDRPRPMSDEERAWYQIADDDYAAIAKGALQRDVFNLLRDARQMGLDMGFNEAKEEVARVGIATAGTGTYTYNNKQHFKEKKQGRPLIWTAIEGAERDLLRQLTPILKRSRENLEQSTRVEGGQDWSVHQFVRVPSGTELEDMDLDEANDALFGPEPMAEEGDFEEVEDIDEEAVEEARATVDPPTKREGQIADFRSHLENNPHPTVNTVTSMLAVIGVIKNDHHGLQIAQGLDLGDIPNKDWGLSTRLTTDGAVKLFDMIAARQVDEEEE